MSRIVFVLGVVLLLVLPASIWASDVSGKWIAETPGQQGNVEVTMVFNVDGEKLTGTIDHPAAGPTDIKDGKVVGDKIAFYVVREFGGNEMKVVWKGTIAGDEIKYQRTIDMGGAGGGGFGGGPGGGEAKPSPDIIAKRVK